MSAFIRVSCLRCGLVEVPVAASSLTFTLHGDDLRNVLAYTCPGCGIPAQLAVDEGATRLLSSAGVTLVATTAAEVDSGHGTSN